LEQAREYWQSIEFPEELLQANNEGFLFLKDLLDCKHSINHIIGSKSSCLIQYQQFITLYNSLDIGEKIHGGGQLVNIARRILQHVPGMILLNEEADHYLNQEKKQVLPTDDMKQAAVETPPPLETSDKVHDAVMVESTQEKEVALPNNDKEVAPLETSDKVHDAAMEDSTQEKEVALPNNDKTTPATGTAVEEEVAPLETSDKVHDAAMVDSTQENEVAQSKGTAVEEEIAPLQTSDMVHDAAMVDSTQEKEVALSNNDNTTPAIMEDTLIRDETPEKVHNDKTTPIIMEDTLSKEATGAAVEEEVTPCTCDEQAVALSKDNEVPPSISDEQANLTIVEKDVVAAIDDKTTAAIMEDTDITVPAIMKDATISSAPDTLVSPGTMELDKEDVPGAPAEQAGLTLVTTETMELDQEMMPPDTVYMQCTADAEDGEKIGSYPSSTTPAVQLDPIKMAVEAIGVQATPTPVNDKAISNTSALP
jgi:hypothetical protein